MTAIVVNIGPLMPTLRLHLHDTLSAKLTPVEPRHPGELRVYTCGPTVYDVAHIGHARAAVAPDILVRHDALVLKRQDYFGLAKLQSWWGPW